MKYKDYYQVLGVPRSANASEIKKAYRQLAHQYHPDISKDPAGEEKFKEVAEAYAILKSKDKKAEYDGLGQPETGNQFTPPPRWQNEFSSQADSFDDVDLSDIFKAFNRSRNGAGGHRKPGAIHGDDYSVNISVGLEKVLFGGETDVTVELPAYDEHGLPHRAPHTFRIQIPKGAMEGQRLRLAGKGGLGVNGGENGDLYIKIHFLSDPIFRVTGRDIYFDLPISPAEAALGDGVEIAFFKTVLTLQIKAGTCSGQRLRLARKGLPAGKNGESVPGDLYAVIQIVVPKNLTEVQRTLYAQLATVTEKPMRDFNVVEAR